MSDGTKIGWTDSSWPVVTGCTHLSEGCDHCYAAKLTSGRLRHLPAYEGLAEAGRFNGTVRLLPDRLDWPQRWRKPRRIFVSDMADLFHDGVPDDYVARVWQVMATAPQHTFQVLTKRHARMRAWMNRCAVSPGGWITHDGTNPARACDGTGQIVGYPAPRGPQRPLTGWRGGRPRQAPQPIAYGWPLPNVHAGVSVETQRWADNRIPALLETPAAVRWLSCEPLLGPLDLDDYLADEIEVTNPYQDAPDGAVVNGMEQVADDYWKRRDHIGWVVVGGESGPGHRPMDIGWLESIVGQCRRAGVPVFVKQDSGTRAGQQGRIPDELWIHEFPTVLPAAA